MRAEHWYLWQKVSRRAMLYSIEQLFSLGATLVPLSTGCTTTLLTPKSVPPAGLIRDVLCRRVAFQRPLTLYSGPLWQTSADYMIQVPSSLPTWTTGTCGSKRTTYCRHSLLSLQPPVNFALQPTKIQVWRASCQDPIPPEFQDKVKLTLSCLGGHLQVHDDLEPSPVVLGEQATMEKTTQRFQRIATTLADLNAEGLNAQAVNDLLTMYVGAASQHVLRMRFVPEQEAYNFDRQVTTFWSHLIQRDITSPLFFRPLKLGGLGVGSAVQRHAAAPWRAWQAIIPTLVATTKSPDTDSLVNGAHPFTTNEQTRLPTQTTWGSPSPKNHSKETRLYHPKKHPQATSQQPRRHTC